ncbi:hypothetical protein J0X15_12025 [Roseibium sp. CAU 1637]|uniref:Uncharacterized protein n=1 Tax=Roseibium limicola TaxID=2816037 RepID=A0A939J934_9HYPH|nr:hypothetical protein [Roseibium limicola]MBO0345951.1 hypothetical protein [Roseibium limicola]
MTELIGFAALAVGGYWVFKRVKKKLAEAEETLGAMRNGIAGDRVGKAAEGVALVQDPVTGKYRPRT